MRTRDTARGRTARDESERASERAASAGRMRGMRERVATSSVARKMRERVATFSVAAKNSECQPESYAELKRGNSRVRNPPSRCLDLLRLAVSIAAFPSSVSSRALQYVNAKTTWLFLATLRDFASLAAELVDAHLFEVRFDVARRESREPPLCRPPPRPEFHSSVRTSTAARTRMQRGAEVRGRGSGELSRSNVDLL